MRSIENSHFIKTATGLVAAICLLFASHVSAQSPLTTTFLQNNGAGANIFDLKSLTGVMLTDFDVNAFTATTTTVEVWIRNASGTYIGSGEDTDPTKWTMLASVPNVSATPGVPNNLGLSLAQPIVAGETRAMAIGFLTGTIGYTNGTTEGALFASNTDLEFFEGRGGAITGATWSWPNVPRVWNGNIHYLPLSNQTDDVQLARIVSPLNNTVDCSTRSASENVTIEIRALGTNPVASGSLLLASYQVDNNPPVSEAVTVTTALNQGDILPFTFTTPVNLSAVGNYTLTASVIYALDLDPNNDSLATNITSGGQLRVSIYPATEDFTFQGSSNDLPLGWQQEPGDNTNPIGDWIMTDTATLTANTGPAADNTTGVAGSGGYAYFDGDSFATNIGLRSACYDLSPLITPRMRFFMHSNGNFTPSNTLAVDVLDATGTLTVDALPPIGHLGNDWQQQILDLTPFLGQVVQFIFRGDAQGTGNLAHDIAIDDFSVIELVPTPGQPQQPGLAIFDVNQSANANGDLVTFGFGGPFFTDVSAGDILNFKMEGEPNQAIILFTGPFNPGAASYAGIGQIDVGAAIDPNTGLPTQLVVLADGSAFGGFNPFFVTSNTGRTDIGFSVPNFPPGILGTFQCAMLTAAAPNVALSNAVQVTVN